MSEAKLEKFFLEGQFHVDGFTPPYKMVRNPKGSWDRTLCYRRNTIQVHLSFHRELWKLLQGLVCHEVTAYFFVFYLFFSMRGYLTLIGKYFVTYMNGLAVYAKEMFTFVQDFSL